MCRTGATIKYTNRIYKPGGDFFEAFKETDKVQTMPYPMKDLDDSHELWQKANARCNARLYLEKQALAAVQEAVKPQGNAAGIGTYDLSDIDQYFQKHGKGSHLLEYDFTPDTPEPIPYKRKKGNSSSIFWCWTHKLTKHSTKRYATPSGKSCDTGALVKALGRISAITHPLAFARAQKILILNSDARFELSVDEVPPPLLDRRQRLNQQVSDLISVSLSSKNCANNCFFFFSTSGTGCAVHH